MKIINQKMGFIRSYFNNEFIRNTDEAMEKEFILASKKGAYASSTIVGCNTRKYHGLLIVPQPQLDDDDHVLLSAVDETIIYKNKTHQLGVHKYPGTFYPTGYEYADGFYGSPILKWIYKTGDAVFTKEILLTEKNETALIRYSLIKADEVVEINLSPFLAFRNTHHLSKANLTANKKFTSISNGIKLRMYPHYSELFLQLSKKNKFIPVPDWYYFIEYNQDKNNGYDYHEDLFVPGFFQFKLKEGEQIIFSASLKEGAPKSFKTQFTSELKKKRELITMDDCLQHAAQQFIVKKDKKYFIRAGYHWFGCWGRDTFISLPGLTLATNQPEIFISIINSMVPDLKAGLFPNVKGNKTSSYNSVDASLWFAWAIQQYAFYENAGKEIWNTYGKYLSSILKNYKNGTTHSIKMDVDGLIYAGEKGVALTWMDAVVNGKPVTPRIGKAVEINALWYNAVCFCIEYARLAGDNDFVNEWESYPQKIRESFISNFWDEDKKYLADYVNGDFKDCSIRPNQIFAVSLPCSPLTPEMRMAVIENVKNNLLTTRGLRTLSPTDTAYHGTYGGNQHDRDNAYHQGTVWPWLLGHFADAYLKEYGDAGNSFIENIYAGFENALTEKCLFSIAEVYDGDYPHKAGGAISQAWSIAELLRIKKLLNKKKNGKKSSELSVRNVAV